MHYFPDSYQLISKEIKIHIKKNLNLFFSALFFVAVAQLLSHVWLFATPWTITHQA